MTHSLHQVSWVVVVVVRRKKCSGTVCGLSDATVIVLWHHTCVHMGLLVTQFTKQSTSILVVLCHKIVFTFDRVV